MRPQLIIECGGRVLSALLVTADGELVPCSQEIRQVATRYVSADVLFEPRVIQDRDFIWRDALETLSKSSAADFFQRARRIGLRRPWDAQASVGALQLRSPWTVLSSPAALTDRVAGSILPGVGLALLDALLDAAFAFVTERGYLPGDVDPVIVLPAQTGSRARLVVRKLVRRRGFRGLTIVRREIAAAMSLANRRPCTCIVVETSETDLHLYRVEIDGDARRPRFRTTVSATIPGLGWNHWSAQIAWALGTSPSAAFERSLTTLLSGSPDSLPQSLTHGVLQRVLDATWMSAHSVRERLQEHLDRLGGEKLPMILAGEIFMIDAVRRLFGSSTTVAPAIDHLLRNVAAAMRSPFLVAAGGSLRVNTLHGEAVELLAFPQLPAPGEAGLVDSDFRLGGDCAAGTPLLVQLQWGADQAPEGNTTLCAVPLELRGQEHLRLSVHLRRTNSGRRLNGTLEVRMPPDVVVGRARFAEELEMER
ncbi:MAG: hypothetical protein ABI779_23780 [Acidobacteriota bacterium]